MHFLIVIYRKQKSFVLIKTKEKKNKGRMTL